MSAEPTTHLDPRLGRELAHRLLAAEQEIVDAWSVAVRADPQIHSDESLSYPEFVDHIPKVVAEVCAILGGASPAAEAPTIREDARVHGAFRWQQGYDLAEVMREIGHLRRVLIDFITAAREDSGFDHADQPAILHHMLKIIDEGQVTTILTYVAERERELAERDREIALRDREILDRDRRLQQTLLEKERTRSEALESAAHAKDEFLATLSHELRTPLTPILAWITILEKDTSSATIAAAVKTITRNVFVLVRLIDDLLDVSRIVTGKLDFARELVDAREFVTAARDTVLPLAAANNVALRLAAAAEPLPVMGDATRLQQVVWNLLSNAVKFSQPGGEVRIEVSAEDREVMIVVSDDGLGIDPAFLPHIFDRFRQQDQGSTRGHGGLGLGLAIARAISDAHGGRLSASSEGRRKGSRFEFRLPLVPGAAAAEGDAVKGPDGKLPAGLRALLVDADEEARTAVAAMLSRLGCEVRTAATPEEALRLTEGWAPQCVLLDVSHAGSGGLGLLQALEARRALEGLPVIALRDRAVQDRNDEAGLAGIDQHLPKPVTLHQLERALRAALLPRKPN